MRSTTVLWVFATLATPFAGLACSGSIGSGAGPGSDPGAGGGGGVGGGTDPSATDAQNPEDMIPPPGDPVATAKYCESPHPVASGPAPLRRLTNIEYDNTVRDLLGDTSAPSAAFPSDALVFGFDNNATVQGVTFPLAGDYFDAAEALATRAVASGKVGQLVPCDPAAMGQDACARKFITTFGQRAYRRPLEAVEITSLLTTYTQGRTSIDHNNGLKLVMHRMLSAPSFLYRPEFGEPAGTPGEPARLSAWEMASRLSYLLWSSMPDDALFAATAAGQLATTDQLRAQVDRMLADPRTRTSMVRFFDGWVDIERLDRADKDAKLYPGFAAAMPAMKEEIHRVIDDALWEGGGSIRRLFDSDHTFMNKDLASYLGLPGAAGMTSSFSRVPLAPQGPPGPAWRTGVLMTAGLLAANSKTLETSPILRGKFVLQQFLCVNVPPPPPNVNNIPPPAGATTTTRQRFVQHEQATCASCHRLMDPVGFAFENFDTTGRFRATDNGQPVDASGDLTATDVDGPFQNAVDLSRRIADSEQVRACAAKQLFRYAHGRGETDADARSLAQLGCQFHFGADNFRDLLVAITQTDSFNYRPTAGGSP